MSTIRLVSVYKSLPVILYVYIYMYMATDRDEMRDGFCSFRTSDEGRERAVGGNGKRMISRARVWRKRRRWPINRFIGQRKQKKKNIKTIIIIIISRPSVGVPRDMFNPAAVAERVGGGVVDEGGSLREKDGMRQFREVRL